MKEWSESPEFDAALQAMAAAPPVGLGSRAQMRLAPETVIGDTFRIERVLGEGAMGIVYLATDLALDRQVALKLRVVPGDDPRESRLWREAKAMARLSHPNVIAVHEVGVHAGRVYIAMELVDGGTLRDWLRRQPRSWQEVVAVFVQAAQGLVAAHGVGLVHRDFKPTNVLVGSDGRVRVADFGLARAAMARDGEDRGVSPASSPERSPSVDSKLTATGAMVGTPAYMAPEQQTGAIIDHRADQYAFFVSVHEALFGSRRPGRVPRKGARPATGRVPAWLRAAVKRGMQPEPGDRFPDMNAALTALRGDPRRRRRLVLGAVGICVGAAATVGGFALADHRGRAQCRQRAQTIEEVWTAAIRSDIANAFLGTGVPFAKVTFEHLEPFVDQQVSEWRDLYAATCEEAEVDRTRAPELWAAGQSCLEERRRELQYLLEALGEADVATVQDAVSAATHLTPLSRCADDRWLARHPVRDRSGEEYAELGRAAARLAAGRYEQGLELAQNVASADVDPDLRARAKVLGGMLSEAAGNVDEAGTQLAQGYEDAVALGDDDLALEAATELVYVVGVAQHKHDEGLWWRQTAAGLLRRLEQEDGWNAAALHNNVGMVYEAQGKPELALAEHQRALEIRRRERGDRHPFVAYSHNNLGTVYTAQGRYEEAQRELAAAGEILEAVLGPTHPQVAIAWNNLGSLYTKQGRHEDAVRTHERALAAFEGALGADHPQMATSHANLGNAFLQLGRHADAERELDRAFAIRMKALGPDHPGVAAVHNTRGNLYLAQGRHADAEREHRRALAIASEAYGAEHPKTATSHVNLGRVLRALGNPDEARREIEAALRIYAEGSPDRAAAQAELDALN